MREALKQSDEPRRYMNNFFRRPTGQQAFATCLPRLALFRVCSMLVLLAALASAPAADTLDWQKSRDQVSADIKSSALLPVLEKVAAATGWKVYVEPETIHTVSAKFSNLPPGQALRSLLGNLNFALVPETNASPKLFVFRTTVQRATQLVRAPESLRAGSQSKPIPNELIVRLKPGAKIEDIARQLGAKVIGRIDSLNAYRLQFDGAEAADSARQTLSNNSEVSSVDSNYSIDAPLMPQAMQSATVPPPTLQLKPPPDDGRVLVGLVDTAVQSLGKDLDAFLLKQLSIAGEAQLDPNSPSHGTSMAETILRSLQAITKGSTAVQILPVDVYGPNQSTTTFDVANGIVSAVNGGAKVINLSLGSDGDSPFLHDTVQQVSKQKILIFAAAGNQPVTTAFYPAAYSEVTAVTAVDQGQLAPYASRGSFVSLAAPGTSVVYYDGQPYYVTGTSSSAAFISGMAAGYMDISHGDSAKAQTFLQQNFGVKISTVPKK
jgi:hypothetical protein